jgi:hypothetical protein
MAKKKLWLVMLVITFTMAACRDRVGTIYPPEPEPGSETWVPIDRVVNTNLGNMTSSGSGWRQLLDSINTERKYINLNLSACTMTGTEFNPDNTVSTGKYYIVSIVLPTAATSIAAGTEALSYMPYYSSSPTFDNFINLRSVSGANITSIGAYSFDSIYGGVDFPKATTIGKGAFSFCSLGLNGEALNFPQVTTIGDYAFYGCRWLQTLNIPKVTSIGNAAFGGSWSTTLTITMGPAAPTLGYDMFIKGDVNASRTVNVKVPAGAVGYGYTDQFLPITISGSDNDEKWVNGFRGGGWNGTTWAQGGGTSKINQNITVSIQWQ